MSFEHDDRQKDRQVKTDEFASFLLMCCIDHVKPEDAAATLAQCHPEFAASCFESITCGMQLASDPEMVLWMDSFAAEYRSLIKA